MALSVFDLFRIGIGPSSSHTVGPMRAARRFVTAAAETGVLPRIDSLGVELFGSLGATGKGHGSVGALVLGLLGHQPETVDPNECRSEVEQVRQSRRLGLPGGPEIGFDPERDIVLQYSELVGMYWISFFPGIALVLLIVSINLVADRLRDVLNPRLRKL